MHRINARYLSCRPSVAMRWIILFLVVAATPVAYAAGESDDDQHRSDAAVPGVVLVQFKAGVELPEGAAKTGLASFDRIAERHQVYALERAFPFLEQVASKRALSEQAAALRRTYLVRYGTPRLPQRVAAALAQDPNVVYAEPHYLRRITGDGPMSTAVPGATPNDALFSRMTHLQQLRAPEAWDVVKGEQGDVVVAIIDGGTEWRHPDLQANVWTNPLEVDGNGVDDDGNGFVDDIHGWNYATGLPGTADPTGLPDLPRNAQHGTAVAGTAVAVTDNGVGVAGTSWNARFMAVNAACPNQDSLICGGFLGILYAAMNGAAIINASWGGESASETERQVIEVAYEQGALVVAAAGNEGRDADREPFYPAGYPKVLSVSGTQKDSDTHGGFNYGKSVNVFAPGRNIDSTIPNGQYNTLPLNGTSFASPLVTGVAALVKTWFPAYTVDQVREQVRITADNIDAANPALAGRLGRGRVNALRAVTETGSPSIRLTDWSYTTSDGNLDIRSGETVEVTATFTNYLADASGVTLELLSDDPFVSMTTGSVGAGMLATGAGTTVTFAFDMAQDTPNNRVLLFSTRAQAGTYRDEADVFRLPANETAVASHTSGAPGAAPALQVSVTNEGNIGYLAFQGSSSGIGFVTSGRDVLFEGGLLVATGPDAVSDCVRGISTTVEQDVDFTLKDGSVLEIIRPAALTAEQARVEFVDTAAPSPIGLSILQESYVDAAPENEDFIILRYAISNTTTETISNLYAGLFFDWDVHAVDPQQDVAGYDEIRQMGFVQDGLSPTILVGTRVLTGGASLSYRAIDNPTEIYRGGDAGGFSEQEKWDYLRGGVQRKSLGATDVSQLTGVGPFTIDPGSSVEVAFAVVAGQSQNDLLQNADRAQDLWDNTLATPVAIEDPAPGPGRFAFHPLYPHPAVPPASFAFDVAAPSDVTLTVYDVLGRKVRALTVGRKSTGTHSVVWEGTDQAGRRVASGLYIARLTARSAATTFTTSQQVVVVW